MSTMPVTGACEPLAPYNPGMGHVCDFCGRTADGEVLPLTWSFAIERGRTRIYCDACTRANARSNEGRLDSEWW